MPNVPVICLFSPEPIELVSEPEVPWYETNEYDIRSYTPESEKDITNILVINRPDVIVTIGDLSGYPTIFKQTFEVRKKWLHFEDTSDLVTIGQTIYNCFVHNIVHPRKNHPLVSVITPVYKTGWRITRPYQSLLNQTYTNWEWVIIDDSDDQETYSMLEKLASSDSRISVYRMQRHSGKIGETKNRGFMLGQGEYLVELDHDDELIPDCLELVVKTFRDHPEAGFVYSDCTELFETGGSVNYGEHFAFGYGSYRTETYKGQEVFVVNQQNINPKTIRHIVGVPNHVRCWRKDVYQKIGGHNVDLHVADDYEIIIRTFLETRMIRIPKLLYVQYMNSGGNNTQNVRRKEIQRLVRYLSWYYDEQIHARFLELGIDDYVWDDTIGRSTYPIDSKPNPEIEQHCSLIVT